MFYIGPNILNYLAAVTGAEDLESSCLIVMLHQWWQNEVK